MLEAEGTAAAAVTGCAGDRAPPLPLRAARPRTPARRRWTRAATPASPPPRRRCGSSGSPRATAASRRPAQLTLRAGDRRPRSPARRSCSSTCATPRPSRWRAMLADAARRRPRRRPRRGCEFGRGAGLADRADRLRPGAGRRGARACAEAAGRAGELDQRRASRRRRGRARAARRRWSSPLDGRDQPRQGGGHPGGRPGGRDRGLRRARQPGARRIPHLPLRGCLRTPECAAGERRIKRGKDAGRRNSRALLRRPRTQHPRRSAAARRAHGGFEAAS